MTYDHKFQSLHNNLINLVRKERELTSQIIELLQKVEQEKLYLGSGFANLFEYLVRGLGYSESVAYQRKAAVHLCAQLPEVKEMLNQGSLSLSTLARANKVLKTKPRAVKLTLITELENKTVREVDQILAREWSNSTQSFAASAKQCVRKFLPTKETRQLNESTIRMTLDFTLEEFKQIEWLKALKSHRAQNFNQLFYLLVNRELSRYNSTSKQPSDSKNPRQIKVSLKQHLLQKANYKCQFPGCEQTHYLQVDHIQSVSEGGGNHPTNLQVLCQQHNLFKYRQSRATTPPAIPRSFP